MHFSIDDACGDGPLLGLMPGALRGRARGLALKSGRLRRRRMMRAVESIYPSLQAIEAAAIGESQRLLAGKSFAEACRDPRCIERGMMLFEAAWQSDLARIQVRDGGKRLAYGDRRAVVAACGLNIGETEQAFLHMMLAQVFAKNPKALELLSKQRLDRDSLPHLHLMRDMDALAIDELESGLGGRFATLLKGQDLAYLEALSRIKAYQVRALRSVLAKDFATILDWQPEMVAAVIDNFQCVEQFKDLGDFFADLKTPEVVEAFGRWEKRDITDRVNAERAKQGKKKLKGRRFETDIGIVRTLLGADFGKLIERGPEVIAAFAEILNDLRPLDGQDKADRIEQIQLFARRYLAYMTAPMLDALTVTGRTGREVLDFHEIIGMLEGLWAKQGLGAGFYEGGFQTPEGATAVRNMTEAFMEMKRRGSAKKNTDVKSLIANSDLFDRYIIAFLRKAVV